MRQLYLFSFLFLVHVTSEAQTSISVSGQCMTGTIALSPISETIDGKIAYEGTGTVDGNAGVGVSIFWIGAPDNLWVLAFDGQPYFQNSCNTTLPLSSPNNACPWSAVTDQTCTGQAPLTISGSGVLAIRLTSFTGTKSNGKVLLSWKTASETNNQGFEVQRSQDGINWQTIGSLPGAMHSNTELQYHFTDPTPLSGKNYYRLLQKDVDGRTTYSAIISITLSGNKLVQVINTPARGIYQLLVETTEPAELSVYDAAAKKVWSLKAAKGMHKLDLTAYPSGIYLLQARMKGEVLTQKMINP